MKKFFNDQGGFAVIGLVLYTALAGAAGIGLYHASPAVKKAADKVIVNADHDTAVKEDLNDGVAKR